MSRFLPLVLTHQTVFNYRSSKLSGDRGVSASMSNWSYSSSKLSTSSQNLLETVANCKNIFNQGDVTKFQEKHYLIFNSIVKRIQLSWKKKV